jgi:hypothetical protein
MIYLDVGAIAHSENELPLLLPKQKRAQKIARVSSIQ